MSYLVIVEHKMLVA